MEKKYPEPIVGALIVNKEGRIFLMKSPKWHGNYIPPGGHVEWGEKLEAALVREVKEETGLDVYDLKLLFVNEMIFDKAFHKETHFIFLDHVCRARTTEVQLDNREGVEYIWVSPKEALYLPMDHYTKDMIEKYIKDYPDGY